MAVLRAAPAMLRLARGAKFGARRRSLVLVWAMFRDFGQALVPLAPSRRPAGRAGGRLPSPAAMACARFAPTQRPISPCSRRALHIYIFLG